MVSADKYRKQNIYQSVDHCITVLMTITLDHILCMPFCKGRRDKSTLFPQRQHLKMKLNISLHNISRCYSGRNHLLGGKCLPTLSTVLENSKLFQIYCSSAPLMTKTPLVYVKRNRIKAKKLKGESKSKHKSRTKKAKKWKPTAWKN